MTTPKPEEDERYKKALQEIIHTTASKVYTPFQKVERCFGVAASALAASAPSSEAGEWQLCPKCLGGGRAMNMDNMIPTTMDVCDVCNGNKIIAKPLITQPSASSEATPEIEFGNWLVANEDFVIVNYKEEKRWCTIEVAEDGSTNESDYLTMDEMYKIYLSDKLFNEAG